MKCLTPFLMATFGIIACGGNDNPMGPSGGSPLTVMLKDAPFADARSVLVTFSEVTAHQSGDTFTTLPFSGGVSSRTCDLKKLTSATDVLAVGNLAPGHYTMLRLSIASGALYFDSEAAGPPCAPTIVPPPGSSAPLTIPSGVVRLNREFEVTSNTGVSILLDFDGDHSIKETGSGKFVMTPVITIVSVQ